MENLDWTLVRSFLAVAESGSLSDAARQLSASQPTIGRHVKQMESQLGVSLFSRQARGYALTEAGQALVPYAHQMWQAMQALQLAAAGRSEQLSGPVRITASVFMAHHHIPAILAQLRQNEPAISIDLVATDQSDNLLFREADIAIRMYRPEQLDVVTQHIGDLALGAYGAHSYLDRVGRPESLRDFGRFDLIGYDRSELILKGMRAYGIEAQRDWFAVRTDAQTSYWELIRHGAGIGFAQCSVADKDPLVEQVLPDLQLPKLPVWLAAHETMRRTPRIRRVWDALASGLAALVS